MPWVSPIVVVPRRNIDQIGICVDTCVANKAILRKWHPLLTTEELISDLNGVSVFSKIDLDRLPPAGISVQLYYSLQYPQRPFQV